METQSGRGNSMDFLQTLGQEEQPHTGGAATPGPLISLPLRIERETLCIFREAPLPERMYIVAKYSL